MVVGANRARTVTERQIRLAGHVRWAEVDGVVYVLDLRRGAYSALDPAWSPAWLAAVGDGPAQSEPASDGPEAAALIGAARRRGWISDVPDAGAPIRPDAVLPMLCRVRPSLAAWYALVRAGLQLRRGFWPAYSALARGGAPQRGGTVGIADATSAFLRAEQAFVSRLGVEDCVPRSFALFRFLRDGCGLRAEHVIGIRRYPFSAHAWVQYDGVPVFDKPDRIASFTPIARVAS
jgi:Transglutaminase-like superfamily